MVVALVLFDVSCGDHRPSTNATNKYFDGKGHESNMICGGAHHLSLRYLEPTGLNESTKWDLTHDLDSSCTQ